MKKEFCRWFRREFTSISLVFALSLIAYWIFDDSKSLSLWTGLSYAVYILISVLFVFRFKRIRDHSFLLVHRFLKPEERIIYFRDKDLSSNCISRLMVLITSLWSLKWAVPFLVLASYFHFKYSKEAYFNEENKPHLKYTELRLDHYDWKIMSEPLTQKATYFEKDYLLEKGNVLVNILVIIAGIIISNYWNRDAIFGRIWQYCCDQYSDFIDSLKDRGEESKRHSELKRVSLCIDILDHRMWNSDQFKVFFRFELMKLYYFLNSNSELIKRISKDKKNHDLKKYYTSIRTFIDDFEKHCKKTENSNELHLEFAAIRDVYSYMSMLVEEPDFGYPDFTEFTMEKYGSTFVNLIYRTNEG